MDDTQKLIEEAVAHGMDRSEAATLLNYNVNPSPIAAARQKPNAGQRPTRGIFPVFDRPADIEAEKRKRMKAEKARKKAEEQARVAAFGPTDRFFYELRSLIKFCLTLFGAYWLAKAALFVAMFLWAAISIR